MSSAPGTPFWGLKITGPNLVSGSQTFGAQPNLEFDSTILVSYDPLNSANKLAVNAAAVAALLSGSGITAVLGAGGTTATTVGSIVTVSSSLATPTAWGADLIDSEDGNQWVAAISGLGGSQFPVFMHTSALIFDSTQTGSITQQGTNGPQGAPLTISAQDADNGQGGDLNLTSGRGSADATAGDVIISTYDVVALTIGASKATDFETTGSTANFNAAQVNVGTLANREVLNFVANKTTFNATPMEIIVFDPPVASGGRWSLSCMAVDQNIGELDNFFTADLNFCDVNASGSTVVYPNTVTMYNTQSLGSLSACSLHYGAVTGSVFVSVTGVASTEISWTVWGSVGRAS